MSNIDIQQGNARVVVDSDHYGIYNALTIRQLCGAVAKVCRAIGSAEALALAEAITEQSDA